MNPEDNKYLKSSYDKPSLDSATPYSNSETDNPLVGSSPLFPSASLFSSPLVEAFEFKANDVPATAAAEPTQPRAGLYEHPIPPFLSKTYDLVNDQALDQIISWGARGESFVVWDAVEFSRIVLPRNFKHNNFSSFVRQLNTYGFRKIDNDKWEFANDAFKRGEKHLLKNIHRRKSPHAGSSVEAGKSNVEKEVEILRKERSMMLQEVVELQQQQHGSVHHIETVNRRLHAAERRQKQMLSFLSKLFQNPAILTRLRQNKEQANIGSPRMKKLVKHQAHEPGQFDSPIDGQIVKYECESKDASASFIVPKINPVLDEKSFDYNLQHILETGEEALGMPFPVGSAPSELAAAEGYCETHARFAEGTTIRGSGNPQFKGKNVINPQQAFMYGNPMSFPKDLVAEKTFPEFPSPENESIVKEEDAWTTVFDRQASAPSSRQELWGNLVPYDLLESGISDDFSDIWDLGSAVGGVGIQNWPIDEKPDAGPDCHIGHVKDDRLNRT